jgi:hypothetical protein
MEEFSYRKALTLLSADGRTTFGERLAEWRRASPQIAENFEREHFLPAEEMKELMEFIIREGAPVGDEQKMLRNELIYPPKGDLQLKGGEIKFPPKLKRIGFAIPEKKYKEFLLQEYGGEFSHEEDEVDKFLKTLLSGEKDEDCIHYLFRAGHILLWVTWGNKGDNPFPFLPSSDNEYPDSDQSACWEVRVALALGKEYESRVLLFFADFEKIKDKGGKFFRPTFCDADFGEHFRPAPLGFNDHGLTWPLGKKDYEEKEHKKEGRPEAVVRSEHIVLDMTEKVILLNQ